MLIALHETDCVVADRMLSQKHDTREEAMVLHKEPPQKKSSGCCWTRCASAERRDPAHSGNSGLAL